MPELRWTLLIIGALFVIGLALWEFRRQRKLPRNNANTHGTPNSDRVISSLEASNESAGPRIYREPTINLPELHPEPSVESRVEPRMGSRLREPSPDLPVVEVGADEFSRLESEAEPSSPSLPDEDLLSADPALDARTVAINTVEPADDSWLDDAGFTEPEPGARASEEISHVSEQVSSLAAPDDISSPQADAATSDTQRIRPLSETSTGFVSDNDAPAPEHVEPSTRQAPVGATAAGAPKVDWPGEDNRKIVALRLVSHPAARFQGRAVRQALAAEGFILGKFDIFHKPGPDDRAVMSVASLTKPGTFALNTIDAQRFGGISLFAVLPGPLPAQQTFDELLTTARSLNDRLQGALQDERGEPLTPTRSATIRQSLSDGSGNYDEPYAPHPETRQ